MQLLLQCGAGPNWTFGANQTSPLQWAVFLRRFDIVRLLLRVRNLHTAHVNALGWNALYMCWPKVELGSGSKAELLGLLLENDAPDLELTDVRNATVLQRVAACGTRKDLQRLLDEGASPHADANINKWNAMHYAVDGGNMEAIEVLQPFFEHIISSMTDKRGWTLLHIAAAMGHSEVIRYLIGQGCDTQALSRPCLSSVPLCLKGEQCTPRDAAATGKAGALERYTEVMRSLGIESHIGDVDEADDEVYYDALQCGHG